MPHRYICIAMQLLLLGTVLPAAFGQPQTELRNSIESRNGDGIAKTVTTRNRFNLNNPFFKPLGTNGRSCATCHVLSQGLNITPDYVQSVFDATDGLDPLFAAVDGSNNPRADMSNVEARRANCSMLLNKGLIRVEMRVPENAEFSVENVDDPYGYSTTNELSCFRRPLPSTNLRFLPSVMWDGRESPSGRDKFDSLKSQVIDAVAGHMQGVTPPTEKEIAQIIEFETHLFTTQVFDQKAGDLTTPPNDTDPLILSKIRYYTGINDAFELIKDKTKFNQNVFNLFSKWSSEEPNGSRLERARLAIARGERIFNTRKFTISGVAGLTDVIARSKENRIRFLSSRDKTTVSGTCSACHNSPGMGNDSLPLLMNTGISDASLRTADMPLYRLRNNRTGAIIQTTDPGAAMTSGKWSDIGKFKVPRLRALETQSPYMHNGFSGDLMDIINFYNRRFHIGLSNQEKSDLEAFLRTL